jgi:hypothetical protein
MTTRRVTLAPHLLRTLISEKQPLNCTNLVEVNVRESGTPGERPAPLPAQTGHPRDDLHDPAQSRPER